jgi:autotransporter-associated beta strand protein
VVEQGVLTFSEPALTGNSMTNYTVQPGGQLRLSSAGSPRNYLFKGPLNLAGSGRSGVPDNENLGVLGALRLETGTTGTTALLTNNVHLTASADIHVPSGNTIRLDGPLTAGNSTSVLAKSGGGTLTLSSAAAVFTGGLAVNRGTLQIGGAFLTNTGRPLILGSETVLTGTGHWGGGVEALGGSTLAFVTAASPGGAASLRAGSLAASGSVVVSVTPGEGAGAGFYPLLAVDGTATGVDNLVLSLATTNFPASRLSFTNGTLYAVLATSVDPAEAWLVQYGFPADGTGEGADTADPDGDGVVNLVERALFLDPRVAEAGWPVTTGPDGEAFVVTYRVARDQSDLTVTAESLPVLGPDAAWTALGSEVADDTNPDYRIYRAVLPRAGAGFVRLKVTR